MTSKRSLFSLEYTFEIGAQKPQTTKPIFQDYGHTHLHNGRFRVNTERLEHERL